MSELYTKEWQKQEEEVIKEKPRKDYGSTLSLMSTILFVVEAIVCLFCFLGGCIDGETLLIVSSIAFFFLSLFTYAFGKSVAQIATNSSKILNSVESIESIADNLEGIALKQAKKASENVKEEE